MSNEKLCSYCDEPAVRGGRITAFCITHFAMMTRYDERYGWKTASERFERDYPKIRDVNFEEDSRSSPKAEEEQ
jgi:hypothetical protein